MIGQHVTDFYEFRIFSAQQGKLCEWLDARRAQHTEGEWLLEDVTHTDICAQPPQKRHYDEWQWPSVVQTSLLANAALRPSILASKDLLAYVNYLDSNGLDSYRYLNAFCRRLFYLPTVLLLVWLGLPLVIGPIRQISRGRRLALGLSLGLGMYILQQLCESIAAVYRWHPALGSLLPLSIGLCFGIWVYRKTW